MRKSKEERSVEFKLLMEKINLEYPIGRRLFIDTFDGRELAEIMEHNESPFFGSCSVVFCLDNGHNITQMFTTSILESL